MSSQKGVKIHIEMHENVEKNNKKRLRLLALVLGALLLIVLCSAFVLLIKVKGNISYLYNFMVATQGSLAVESNPSALQNADADKPYAVEGTKPENFLKGTALQVDGVDVNDYQRAQSLDFNVAEGANFTNWEGIITFRGNYRRSMQSYGTVSLEKKQIAEKSWRYKTGKVLKCDGVNYWSGNGWTGQPLVVKWDEKTKQHMNLYPLAKNKVGLTEVIYPGMDGQIHFLDMETGEETRDAINVGMTFKGTASLHPEYPLLVCGSGDSQPGMYGEQVSARVFIYSLLDGKKLYELGADDDFAPRIWHGYDSSAVFCTAADTLICPGENGVIYTIRLNSFYDKENGVLTIDPSEAVKFTYYAETAEQRIYSGEGGYGSEASAVVWDHYLYLGDNGGIFYCLDLDTMTPVWVQDLREDINSSPVFEEDENGNRFVYAATTLKYHTDEHHLGEACIYKINAMTGEIIWKKPYEVHTVMGLAGGFLSTGALGKGAASEYLYYSVSKVPDVDTAYIVAIEKDSGNEAWRIELSCDAWSSAAMLYDTDGSVYLVQCCSSGDVLLINALTGEIVAKRNYGSNIEATPAVYGNRLVVGLRSEYILGISFE